MTHEISQIQDPALFSLTAILRFFDSTVDTQQIRKECGTAPIGVPEMVRVANELGFKARAKRPKWAHLSKAALPGVAALHGGGFLILGKLAEDKVLVLQPGASRPEVISRGQFESLWDGRLVLVARRGRLYRVVRRGVDAVIDLARAARVRTSEFLAGIQKLPMRIRNPLVETVTAMVTTARHLLDDAYSSFFMQGAASTQTAPVAL